MDCLAAPERLVPPPTHAGVEDDEMTSLGPATIHILSGLRQAFADGPLQTAAPELAFDAGAGSARSGAAGATGSADAAGGTSGRDRTHRTRKYQGSDSVGCPSTMCQPCCRRGQKQRREERRLLTAADLASRNRHRRIAYARERAAWWATELDRLESEAADSAAGPAGQPS